MPVNGNKYPYTEDALRTQLNKIYGQAAVKWNITFASNLDVPGIDPFDDGGSGLLSNYSPDMRKVVNAYKANIQPNTYYLFLVKNPKSGTDGTASMAGFMPRSKSVGFIFLDKNGSEEVLARTIAHELGHGAFQLRHTFADERNTLPKGTTTNLMDYVPAGQAGVDGTKLYKYQWDRVRYREIVIGLFEGDDAGAMVETLAVDPWPCNDNFRKCNFLLNNNRKIRITQINLECLDNGKGTLFMADNRDLYFRRPDQEYNEFWYLKAEDKTGWKKVNVFSDNCLSCDIATLENIMYKTSVKYGFPAAQMIIGTIGIAAAIPTGGASIATLAFAPIGIPSGSLSIVNGIVEIAMVATGRDDDIKKLPKGIFDVVIGLPIKSGVKNEATMAAIDLTLTVMEGRGIKVNYKDAKDLEKLDDFFNYLQYGFEAKDDVSRVWEKLQKSGVTIQNVKKK